MIVKKMKMKKPKLFDVDSKVDSNDDSDSDGTSVRSSFSCSSIVPDTVDESFQISYRKLESYLRLANYALWRLQGRARSLSSCEFA